MNVDGVRNGFGVAAQVGRANVGRRTVLRGLGGAAVLGWAVSACGDESPGSGGGGTPQRGGTLRVGLAQGNASDSIDPVNNKGSQADYARMNQLFDPLLVTIASGEIEPWLAESVESSDGKTWTIKLRDGVVFHDGKPMTADDVVYSFKAMTEGDSSRLSNYLPGLDRSSIKAVDKHTVRLVFAQPYGAVREVLALPANPKLFVMPTNFDPKAPVGTGPFKYKSFTPGQRSVFVRNENYWRSGEPYLDRIELINFTDDAARVNALLGGQVDAVMSVPSAQTSVVTANGSLKLLRAKTGRWSPIVMRTDIAPFSDNRVRQAFRLIADRTQLVDQALSGNGSIANDLYGRFDPAFHSALPQREQDLDKAKFLLKQAGESDLSLPLVTSDIGPALIQSAQVFAKQASAAGVKLTLKKVDATTWINQYFLKAPLMQDFWPGTGFLLTALGNMAPGAAYNETHWNHPQWWERVKKALAEPDEAARTGYIHDAQEIEWNEGGYLNWGWLDTIDGYSDKVHGLEPAVSGTSLGNHLYHKVWVTP